MILETDEWREETSDSSGATSFRPDDHAPREASSTTLTPQKASVLRTCRRTLRQPSPRTAFTTERESRLILAFRPHHFSNIPSTAPENFVHSRLSLLHHSQGDIRIENKGFGRS